MKTKSLKGLVSVLLAMVMLMSLVPMSALAATYDDDGKVTSIEFQLAGYSYGNNLLTKTGVSGETGITFIHETSGFYTCKEDTFSSLADLEPTTDEYLCANKQYYYVVNFSAHWECEKGFAESFTAENTTLKVNDTVYQPVGAERGENGEYIGIFRLPMLEAIPMAIPFTKIVEQGGNVAPDTESFELEVKNLYEGSNSPIDSYTLDGLSFTTEGSGTWDKQFTVSNDSFEAVWQLLNEGILVSEKQSENAGWQYDSTLWCVKLHHDPIVNALDEEASTMPGYSFDFFKGEMVDGEFVPDSETPTDTMTFTNIYTEDEEAVTTVKIPFVKKVTLGGDVAPAGETFKFEIFDIGNGNLDEYADVTYTAEVTVNGKGEFESELVITGLEFDVEQLICEGFYVREVNGNARNWTYSDAVWHIVPEWVPVEGETVEIVPNPDLPIIGNQQGGGYEPEMVKILSIYPTTKVVENGETYYEDAAETEKKMIFENIYTENKVVAPSSPQTGDNSMMGLWIALLFVSGFGVAAITVISKKRSLR